MGFKIRKFAICGLLFFMYSLQAMQSHEAFTGGDNPSWLHESDSLNNQYSQQFVVDRPYPDWYYEENDINLQNNRRNNIAVSPEQTTKILYAKKLREKADKLLVKNPSNVLLQESLKRMPQLNNINHENYDELDDLETLLFPANTNLNERFMHAVQQNIPDISVKWSWNPFNLVHQSVTSFGNACTIPAVVCNNVYKEGQEIITDTVKSLYWSDYLWMIGGYACADGLLRRTENSLVSAALTPLYVIAPLTALWIKKCRFDMFSILYKNREHTFQQNVRLHNQNSALTRENNEFRVANNRLNAFTVDTTNRNQILQTDNHSLQNDLRRVELRVVSQNEALRREEKRNQDLIQRAMQAAERSQIIIAGLEKDNRQLQNLLNARSDMTVPNQNNIAERDKIPQFVSNLIVGSTMQMLKSKNGETLNPSFGTMPVGSFPVLKQQTSSCSLLNNVNVMPVVPYASRSLANNSQGQLISDQNSSNNSVGFTSLLHQPLIMNGNFSKYRMALIKGLQKIK